MYPEPFGSVSAQKVIVHCPGVLPTAAGKVGMTKSSAVSPTAFAVVAPQFEVGVRSAPPNMPVRKVAPFCKLSATCTLLRAEPPKLLTVTLNCTGLPGATRLGLGPDLSTNSSSISVTVALCCWLMMPGCPVICTAPWGMLLVKVSGLLLAVVPVKLTVIWQLPPAGML